MNGKHKIESMPWQKVGLPPYGTQATEWQVDAGQLGAPEGFKIGGRQPSPTEWQGWMDELVEELGEFLWPRFDVASGKWFGRAARTAESLTCADLKLMTVLTSKQWQPIDGRIPNARLHSNHFSSEDEAPPGADYSHYDPAVSATFVRELTQQIRKGAGNIRQCNLYLKNQFQRPRPYQGALLLGMTPFAHRRAKSGDTPSAVSGHCLQGSVGVCTAYLGLRPSLAVIDDAQIFLQQLAVDPGDRRVFSGVHYPSDNLASWFCSLRLCKFLYGADGADAATFVWGSIQRSHVFKAVSQVRADVPVYAEILRRLEKEAT